MSTEKKSVCDGCGREHVGCWFECKERERERYALIKERGEFFDMRNTVGSFRTNYRIFDGGRRYGGK